MGMSSSFLNLYEIERLACFRSENRKIATMYRVHNIYSVRGVNHSAHFTRILPCVNDNLPKIQHGHPVRHENVVSELTIANLPHLVHIFVYQRGPSASNCSRNIGLKRIGKVNPLGDVFLIVSKTGGADM